MSSVTVTLSQEQFALLSSILAQSSDTPAPIFSSTEDLSAVNDPSKVWTPAELERLTVRYVSRGSTKWTYDNQTPGAETWVKTSLFGVARLHGYDGSLTRAPMTAHILASQTDRPSFAAAATTQPASLTPRQRAAAVKRENDARAKQALSGKTQVDAQVLPPEAGVTAPSTTGYSAEIALMQAVALVQAYPQIATRRAEVAADNTRANRAAFRAEVIALGREYLASHPDATRYVAVSTGNESLMLDLTALMGTGISTGMEPDSAKRREAKKLFKAGKYSHQLYGQVKSIT